MSEATTDTAGMIDTATAAISAKIAGAIRHALTAQTALAVGVRTALAAGEDPAALTAEIAHRDDAVSAIGAVMAEVATQIGAEFGVVSIGIGGRLQVSHAVSPIAAELVPMVQGLVAAIMEHVSPRCASCSGTGRIAGVSPCAMCGGTGRAR